LSLLLIIELITVGSVENLVILEEDEFVLEDFDSFAVEEPEVFNMVEEFLLDDAADFEEIRLN
jgi:hypothetical protein